MNVAITDGLQLMPPAFSDGLENWSSEDGRPGDADWAGVFEAALVPADPDFGGCLEMLKQDSVQRIRSFAEIPLMDGVYLQVTARVKAMSGPMPRVRIAGWPGRPGGGGLSGVVKAGPTVQLDTYGEVVTVRAIIGKGPRGGVDLSWPGAVFAHLGLDLTGASGGTVRIDEITVEDVTAYYLRDMLSVVDVTDYGAVGDGVTDDHAAFVAAHAAADGRTLLVPEGTYRIERNLTLRTPVRFEGFLSMPPSAKLALTRQYDFPTYADAFPTEQEALLKAIQVLYSFTDHVELDLGGRRIPVDEPIDVAALTGADTFAARRVIKNGELEAQAGSAWEDGEVTGGATYDPGSNQRRLTSVENIQQIEIGSRITGIGVGREVYVCGKSDPGGWVELSQPLFGGAGRQGYTFTRHRFILDFSGFTQLSKQVIERVGFQCSGRCSGILLANKGVAFQVRDCAFAKPKDKAITSYHEGCQGMKLDRNEFESNEQQSLAQDRTSIVYNSNANDTKVRDNRAVLFAAFAVIHGTGHTIAGNHWFSGDGETNGVRQPGLILTTPSSLTTITGNYIDNATIELTNEHEAYPDHSNQFSFGGLTISGNIFTAKGAGPWFRWIRIKPYGSGHFISGLTVSHNTFRTLSGTVVDRIDEVDTTYGTLNRLRMRSVTFEGNTFAGVTQHTVNPATINFAQSGAERVWEVPLGDYLPFDAGVRTCTALVPRGIIRDAQGARYSAAPYVDTYRGSGKDELHVHWPEPVYGQVTITGRMDTPT